VTAAPSRRFFAFGRWACALACLSAFELSSFVDRLLGSIPRVAAVDDERFGGSNRRCTCAPAIRCIEDSGDMRCARRV
jgi:hypothetical protein